MASLSASFVARMVCCAHWKCNILVAIPIYCLCRAFGDGEWRGVPSECSKAKRRRMIGRVEHREILISGWKNFLLLCSFAEALSLAFHDIWKISMLRVPDARRWHTHTPSQSTSHPLCWQIRGYYTYIHIINLTHDLLSLALLGHLNVFDVMHYKASLFRSSPYFIYKNLCIRNIWVELSNLTGTCICVRRLCVRVLICATSAFDVYKANNYGFCRLPSTISYRTVRCCLLPFNAKPSVIFK